MDQESIFGRMTALCSRCEYCTGDIESKIRRMAASSDVEVDVEGLLKRLKDEGYVDDDRYAAAFAADKAALDGWGPAKIAFALRKKGLSSQSVDKAVDGIDREKADEKLEKIMAAKARSLADDPDKRNKLIKFALSRGYGYDRIKKLI